ncbi:SulP family inorganic anion transporter [Geminisphaera colitermitum]|uniref:SulP family inorganic anion transporter n=1 Tax=Geminisphaera colitermitum TaxID=1148786 RepID=UPI000158C8BE|nr:SulP family inorganic anion transporter [Geminisphaera colitermitum]
MSAPLISSQTRQAAASVARSSGQWLRDRFPLGAELRKYSWDKLRADGLAAATVSLVSIPQAIGFALIAGLPPLMVIMSVIVGGFVAALFTSSHHLVFGPSNSLSIVLAATIYSFTSTDLTPAQITIVLAALIGIFQLTAGLAQFGKITQFISRSVIIGYGTAIGILLAAGQVSHFFGIIDVGSRGSFIGTLWAALDRIVHLQFNGWALAIGVLTLVIFEVCEHYIRRIPAELIGLVIIALITKYGHLNELIGLRTIADEGVLSVTIPSFIGMPLGPETWGIVPSLLGAALAISILGMLEAVSIAKTMAAKSGQQIDVNQELISMGTANIVTSAYGAMPGSASFARSGANYQSGARTQMSALMSSSIVLAALFFVGPLINYIPVASLAAHLIRIGLRMINREQLRLAWRATRSDAFVLVTTFASAFFLKLDVAIYVGVGLSLVLFLRKAGAPSLVEYTFDDAGQLSQLDEDAARKNSAISIVHVEGELFFGAADLFQEQVRQLASDSKMRVVILRMKNARHLDATSVMSLLQLHDYMKGSGRHLLVSGINPDVERVLRRSGAWAAIGSDNIFPAEANLTMSTKRALLRASRLLQQDGEKARAASGIRIFYDKNKTQETAAPFGDSRERDRPGDFQI